MDSLDQARHLALRILASRPRTIHELRKKLEEKGISLEIIEEILEYCQGYGYLDDGILAKDWIERSLKENPKGRLLLKYQLQERGIEEATIEKALAEAYDDQKEFDLALAAARKKWPSYRNLDREVAERRIWSFLSRRGFSISLAREIINRIRNT